MIRHISSDSAWLHVNQSPTSSFVGNQLSAGMLRYNGQMMRIEVYDGSNWLDFGSSVTVTLSRDAEEVLAWAHRKMREEQDLEMLCQKHPGLQEAYERLQIMKTLVIKETR